MCNIKQMMFSKQQYVTDCLLLSLPLGRKATDGLGEWFKMQERPVEVPVTIFLSVVIFLLYSNSCCQKF